MATPPTIDLERFLNPLSEEEPSGPAAREHPDLSRSFYAIREARLAAVNAEKMIAKFELMTEEEIQQELAGRNDDPRRPPDWRKVYELSEQLLINSSKDLWVVSWMIEAAIRFNGMVGLRDGLNLCTAMTKQYWDTLHPRPDQDDDGARYTVSQLEALTAAASGVIEASPILPHDSRFTWRAYREALDLENDPAEVRALKLESGMLSVDMFATAMQQVGADTLQEIKEDIDETIEACEQFENVMREICGQDREGYIAPSVMRVLECLRKIKNDFHMMSDSVLNPSGSGVDFDQEGSSGGDSGTITAGGIGVPKAVLSREDALQHLLRVADYFRKTEPHSPVSYALEQAVRWGRMPLPELLLELIGEGDTLHSMYKRMGIVPPKNEDY